MSELIRWRPFHGLMRDFFNDISPFFDMHRRRYGHVHDLDFAPHMDVRDAGDEVQVVLDLPGMSKKDIDITVEDGVLVVKGERKDERTHEHNGHVHHERLFGRFERRVHLPEGVDESKLKADYTEGVLTLTAPKTKPVKREPKKVEIA